MRPASTFFIGRKSDVIGLDGAELVARLALGHADAGDRRMAEHRARDVGIIDPGRLVAEHGVGEGLALADRDRGQLDAVGDVADRVDAVGTGRAVVLVDLDRALLAELDARLFEPEPLGVRMRPVANSTQVGVDRLAARSCDVQAAVLGFSILSNGRR